MPLGSGRVGSDNLGYGPGSGFSFEPVQTSTTDPRRRHGDVTVEPIIGGDMTAAYVRNLHKN